VLVLVVRVVVFPGVAGGVVSQAPIRRRRRAAAAMTMCPGTGLLSQMTGRGRWPGSYRVRVSYLPSGPPPSGSDQLEPGDHFLYQIDLWPTSRAAPLAVLKQGPRLWAG
jgi:hypothetical protein